MLAQPRSRLSSRISTNPSPPRHPYRKWIGLILLVLVFVTCIAMMMWYKHKSDQTAASTGYTRTPEAIANERNNIPWAWWSVAMLITIVTIVASLVAYKYKRELDIDRIISELEKEDNIKVGDSLKQKLKKIVKDAKDKGQLSNKLNKLHKDSIPNDQDKIKKVIKKLGYKPERVIPKPLNLDKKI